MKVSEQYPRIDFEAIRSTVNLRELVERDLGPPLRRRRWACPFHHDASNANFSVKDGVWHCFSCGEKGDVFDYVMKRDGISIIEAARRLDGSIGEVKVKAKRPTPSPRQASATGHAWQDPAWQDAIEAIIAKAEANLWSEDGREAMAWLRNRGLDGSTIRRFRLGYLPRGAMSKPLEVLQENGELHAIRTRPGITIPWVHPENAYTGGANTLSPRWVGCQVRCLNPDFSSPRPKYLAVRGSQRGHAYPFAHAIDGLPALVCEGEFDALLAWQELGAAVNVLTVGGVSQTPQPDAMEVLHASPAWLLAFDHDANHAGDNAARKFSGLAPHKCRRVWLTGGANDLTEFHQSGGSLIGWLASEFDRFGWAWPSEPITVDSSAWRTKAAALPWDLWLKWRSRTAELTDTDELVDPQAMAEEIRAAELQAFAEIQAEREVSVGR